MLTTPEADKPKSKLFHFIPWWCSLLHDNLLIFFGATPNPYAHTRSVGRRHEIIGWIMLVLGLPCIGLVAHVQLENFACERQFLSESLL